jgi:hypothetical protein|tara:strand:- start:1367 stop:1729 length:363 start_codon:yes stop_codon:yes gene_type:complete
MTFRTEFVVDQVLTHAEIHGFENAVALVRAHWKITHDSYPNGAAYHGFAKAFSSDVYELDTFTPVEDVTTAMFEQWVTSGLTPETRETIVDRSYTQIVASHEEFGLTTYYQNPDPAWSPQ